MAGCSRGAKRKAIPTESSVRPAVAGSISILTPSAASTSALPDLLETERLPCLATAAVAAGAAGVDQPLPHVRDRNRPLAHGGGGAGDLGHRLALHPQGDQQRRLH